MPKTKTSPIASPATAVYVLRSSVVSAKTTQTTKKVISASMTSAAPMSIVCTLGAPRFAASRLAAGKIQRSSSAAGPAGQLGDDVGDAEHHSNP